MENYYYFDYEVYPSTNATKPEKKDRYYHVPSEDKTYIQKYVDGKLSSNMEVIASKTTLSEFMDLRKHKMNISSFANVTKIKHNTPLKRFLYKKNGNYYCKKSVDDSFVFNDNLLSEEEYKYIIRMGE